MERRQVVGSGRTAEILAWNENQVLKLFRHGWSRSAVHWEENVARTVSDAGLPVPAVYGAVELDGRHGIIYERVDGPSMLKELITKPEKLEHFANIFAKLHAQMHSIKIRGLPSQRQQLKRKIHNAKPLSGDLKKAALKALDKLPDDNVLCHGDFHPDNIQMSTQGPVVIDWNDATRGSPHADVARTLLLLHTPEDLLADYIYKRFELSSKPVGKQIRSTINALIDIYLRQYAKIHSISTEDTEPWRLPITAARLSEGIAEEENRLLSIVEALAKQQDANL